MSDLKVGKDLSPYDDYAGGELSALGWSYIDFYRKFEKGTDAYQWVQENMDIENEVRWISTIAIWFRREEDALAFKLRWS